MLKSLDLLANQLTGTSSADKILQQSEVTKSLSTTGHTTIRPYPVQISKKDTMNSAVISNINMSAPSQTTENINISNNNNNDENVINNNSLVNSSFTEINIGNSISNEIENHKTSIISNSNDNSTATQTDFNKNDEYSKEEPDPDTIKMFAGQIPKSMDEIKLKHLFEEYGRVHSINVLRDKITGISRGCCFVTFYTRKAALKAQDALHNIKTLDGMHHPIQMKPADTENRNERKLFVGMLNKKYNEADVRQLFAGHGIIEECTVLRDQNGQSKGCAFVTFASKQAAAAAIKALDRSRTMDGCSAPLVVKFADTQKEKEQKKLQQLQANLWGIPATATTSNGLTTPITPSPTPITSVAAAPLIAPTPTPTTIPTASQVQILGATNTPQQTSPYLTADSIPTHTPSPSSLALLQHLQGVAVPPTFVPGLSAQPDHNANIAAASGLISPISMHNLMAIASMNHHPQSTPTPHLIQATQNALSTQLTSAATPTLWASLEAITPSQFIPSPATIPHLSNAATFPTSATAATSPIIPVQALTAAAVSVAGKQVEGPEGSNLFIYHLPPEFTDTDLASTFIPFGKVISAKVYVDKNTQKPKGFGFVSYDNPTSAYEAIKAMHGFPIGTRRLKVQLKRSKDAAKPY